MCHQCALEIDYHKLKWLLVNRKRVTHHMELNKFAGAPFDLWWLVAMIGNRYFFADKITFDTLEVEASIRQNSMKTVAG